MIKKKIKDIDIEDVEDIVEYEGNKCDRVFITSDLHGYLAPLRSFIENKTLGLGKNDRIFICGDLIDRGPNSAELVKYVIENNEKHEKDASVPKIIVTLGNHEVMFLCWYAYNNKTKMNNIKTRFDSRNYNFKTAASNFKNNQADWVDVVGEEELKEIFDYFKQLPVIVRVNGGYPFNIVHADLPDKWNEFSKRKKKKLTPEEIDHAIWAREKGGDAPKIKNLQGGGVTYCGHSAIDYMRVSEAKEPILNLDFGITDVKLTCFVEHPCEKSSLPKLHLARGENKNGKDGGEEWVIKTIPFNGGRKIIMKSRQNCVNRILQLQSKLKQLYEYLGYINKGVVSDQECKRKQSWLNSGIWEQDGIKLKNVELKPTI